jgi:hypothetical protein
MLYILGGTARAGKSTIAARFLAETGIPYFCLDVLMMGLARGLPELGIDPEDDEQHVARMPWPVVEDMAHTMVENEEDYLFEGVQLRPQDVADLCLQLPGQVHACFIGFAETDPQAKFEEIRRYGGGPGDWLRELDDATVMTEVKRLIAQSQRIRDECERLGLRYFEIGTDRASAISEVAGYLIEPE